MLYNTIDNILELNLSVSIIFIIINLFLSLILGLIISTVYRKTHKGLSYSQSFVLTIIFLTIITTSVIMVIGNSLARAFALVGTLSIIRFRTVLKDTKDIAIIFLCLAIGLAVGTNNYFIAVFTTLFLCILMWIFFKANFGILHNTEFILRFYYDRDGDENKYLNLLKSNTKYINLLHMEPTEDGKKIYLTYDVSLKEDSSAKELIGKLTKVKNVEEIVLVSSKSDIDY
jgi:hypothetical protein